MTRRMIPGAMALEPSDEDETFALTQLEVGQYLTDDTFGLVVVRPTVQGSTERPGGY